MTHGAVLTWGRLAPNSCVNAYKSIIFAIPEYRISLMRTVLQPLDAATALAVALRPYRTFAVLAQDLGVSSSTAHQSVKRLLAAGLVREAGSGYSASINALEEFLLHGVKYAFPACRSKRQRGVPTAHSAPVLRASLGDDLEPTVWPSRLGSVIGTALEPLLPKAAELPARYPALYDALALVDALRIGTARDRDVAGRHLADVLDGKVRE